jgi:hypothetical protein
MSGKKGSYQVEVDASTADEAIAIAQEGLPRGAVRREVDVRELPDGGYEVTVHFGPAKA